MSAGGYYCMHRGWMKDRLWKHDKYSKREAWCWLIESANFKSVKDFIKGSPVIIPRGSLIQTEGQLAKEWKWGRQQVRTFLAHLKNDEKVTITLTNGLTTISILNYRTYQEKQPKNNPQNNHAVTNGQPTIEEGQEGEEINIDKPKVKKGSRINDDWACTRKLADWANKKGYTDHQVKAEEEKFKLYWEASTGAKSVKLNWDKTFQSWMLNAYSVQPDQGSMAG